MKTRSGFVSNSSSSSFIISKEAYATIWDLAIEMLRIRDQDYHEENLSHHGNIHPLVSDEQRRAVERKHSEGGPEALTFPSCNFDTYIWDAGDSYWVSTCNNHPFYSGLSGQLAQCATKTPCPNPGYQEDIMHYIEFLLEDEFDFERV